MKYKGLSWKGAGLGEKILQKNVGGGQSAKGRIMWMTLFASKKLCSVPQGATNAHKGAGAD